MINKISVFFLAYSFSSLASATVCLFPGAQAIPFNTRYAAGPNVFDAANDNPQVATQIFNAQDRWDGTDANGHLGGWNGTVTADDCPSGQPFQIGAFGFAGSVCATNIAYNVGGTTLAYVDAFANQCPTCGTNSIVVNLNFTWSIDNTPAAGEYDLQSVLAHEFGHVLGFSHQRFGVCTDLGSPSCANSNNTIETLGANIFPGETCQRDITQDDSDSANDLY